MILTFHDDATRWSLGGKVLVALGLKFLSKSGNGKKVTHSATGKVASPLIIHRLQRISRWIS